MADLSDENRTFEPTERKVAQARSQGQTAISRDLSAAVVLLAAWMGLATGGQALLGSLALFVRQALRQSVDGTPFRAAMGAGVREAVSALMLPILATVAATFGVAVAQTRGLVTARPLRPDGERVAPRLGRLWGAERIGFAVKETAKLVALMLVAVISVYSAAPALFATTGAHPHPILHVSFTLAKDLGMALALAMLGLGACDYLWQLYRHRRALRMTRDEVKREQKETEGDPAFRSERRRIHLELGQAYALGELGRSDLILVERGRVAVALRYAANIAQAPIVVLRGRNRLADRMEALAAAAGVPLVVDPFLANRLAATEEGDEIPESLYEAIAELLAEVGVRQSATTQSRTGILSAEGG